MLFSFFNKKESLEVPELLVDVHSHLIPGIDDGANTIEESLILLRALETVGYRKVITTPHVMIDTYRNTPDTILKGLNSLSTRAREVGIKLQIEAAAEYYLDDGFFTHLKEGNILAISGKYILFETSYIAKPLVFNEMVYEIIKAGYTPLLAHPERYRYIQNLEKEYQNLKDRGVLFQVNINSFGGHYGKESKNKAEYLSKNGMIDFLGSDIHHIKQVDTLAKIIEKKTYHQIFQNNKILNNTL